MASKSSLAIRKNAAIASIVASLGGNVENAPRHKDPAVKEALTLEWIAVLASPNSVMTEDAEPEMEAPIQPAPEPEVEPETPKPKGRGKQR